MKVVLKSDRKTVIFVDGITKINANDVNWQLFEIDLETPLALRESLWIAYEKEDANLEITHPFLTAVADNGEYYAQIPPTVIDSAGEWSFQLFIRQYSTTGSGKYVQYASNKYTFTVEDGLPIINGESITYDTIAALYRTARTNIQKFYNADKAIKINANVGTYEAVSLKHLSGCVLIDWGDGFIEDGNGKTETVYTHTYQKAGNYIVRLFNVTDIGEEAFKGFPKIEDLELNKSLLSIGANAFTGCTINKLYITQSVTYLSNCFSETDSIRLVELEQTHPEKFNYTAFKHFLVNLPAECLVIVPTYTLSAYEDMYISKDQPRVFSMRSTETEGLLYEAYKDGDRYTAIVKSLGTATDTDIVIPYYTFLTIDGVETFCDVKRIAEGAFAFNGKITSVSGPGITDIGDAAFIGCTNLTSANFFAVEHIGAAAFQDCTSLTEFSIPDTVEEMERGIFNGCTAIEYLRLPFIGENRNSLRPIQWLFGLADGMAISSLKTVDFSSNTLCEGMFENCPNLERFTHFYIDVIPERAFYNCTKLTAAIGNENVGKLAFARTGITTVYIYNGYVGEQAFADSPLTTVSITYASSIGARAFKTDGTLEYVYIERTIPPELATDAFYGHKSSLVIKVPYGTAQTYKSASGWSSYSQYIEEVLPSLNTPTLSISAEGLATWYSANASRYVYQIEGKSEVGVDKSVTSVYLENGESIRVRAIGDGINYNNSYYTNYIKYESTNILAYELVNNTYYKVVGIGTVTGETVTIPATYRGKYIQEIGANAFANNTTITTVTISNYVTNIGQNAFKGCTSLTSVTIPNSVVNIGENAFKGCTSVAIINLSTSCNNIPNECFAETAITKISIPTNVQSIGTNAFNAATLVEVLTSATTPCTIADNSFGANVERIEVPKESVTLYKNTWTAYSDVIFEEESDLDLVLSGNGQYYIVKGIGKETDTDIYIPETYNALDVREIANNAFYQTNIENVNIPQSVTIIGMNAFNGCKIAEVIISENVTDIGASAFANCDNLTRVTVQANVPPALGAGAFSNCPKLSAISVPFGTEDLYRTAWAEYAEFFPVEEGGGNEGGDDGGGSGGDNGESGGGEEDDNTPVIPRLSAPIVQIEYNGLAHWYSPNAIGYKYRIDKGAEISTTSETVKLIDGQTLTVKAVGDGVNYLDSVYSPLYAYFKDLAVDSDRPALPELEDLDVFFNPFNRYALYKDILDINSEFKGLNEEQVKDVIRETAVTQERDPTVPDWAKQPEKPTYSYDEITDKPALFSGNYNDLTNKPTIPSIQGLATESYVNNASAQAVAQGISSHNVDQTAHKDIRNLISELSNRLNALADSDDTTLDQLSEIVAYIKANKALIESVTTSKVNVSDIINDLETNVANKPLSASQGVALKALVNALDQSVTTLTSKTNELEEYSIREVSLNLVEDNELSVELKDKEGNIVASAETTLPTQDLSGLATEKYVDEKLGDIESVLNAILGV